MKVGLFDSGQGGLTVLKKILNKFPNNEYIYFGDSFNMPYGTKSKDELLFLSSQIVKYFEKENVDLIIIACGTVSSNCYQELKKITSIPIYDILSPTLNVIKNEDSICVMATSMSIQSGIFKNANHNIIEIPCPKFVPLIENDSINTLDMENAIHEYLDNTFESKMVLGCTHFPLIKDKISKVMNKKYEFFDMGEILANTLTITNNNVYKLTLIFSKLTNSITNNINKNFKNFTLKEERICQNYQK